MPPAADGRGVVFLDFRRWVYHRVVPPSCPVCDLIGRADTSYMFQLNANIKVFWRFLR